MVLLYINDIMKKVCQCSKCVGMKHNNKQFIRIAHLCCLHSTQNALRSELEQSEWDKSEFPPSSNAALVPWFLCVHIDSYETPTQLKQAQKTLLHVIFNESRMLYNPASKERLLFLFLKQNKQVAYTGPRKISKAIHDSIQNAQRLIQRRHTTSFQRV